MNKKNLFTWANKELSQDALLRWLFENWEDENLNELVRKLLKEFADIDENEKVITVNTSAQKYDIDLMVEIIVDKGKDEPITLFIEDKTYSCVHSSQLEKYNQHAGNKTKKIFYKTTIVSEWERTEVMNAGWKVYDIHALFSLFKAYKNSSNVILGQYVEHLEEIKNALAWQMKPEKSDSKEELLKWEGYFNKEVVPKIRDKYDTWVAQLGRYKYTILKIMKKGKTELPFLEIRSRDCLNNQFKAKILCWDVKNFTPQESVIEKIKTDFKEVKCKNIRTKKKGEKVFPKQIGWFEKNCVVTSDDFIKAVEESAEIFLQIVEYWESQSKEIKE